jgi:hypothetical protein
MTEAYTDASLVRPDTYALAAVVGRETHCALVRVRHTPHAELHAAGLALKHAPAGPLDLHVDCERTARLLQGLQAPGDPLLPHAQQLLGQAGNRGVDLRVTRVPSALNLAHHPAQRHAQQARREGVIVPGGVPVVRLRVTPDGVTLRGAGVNLARAGPHAALHALLDLALLVTGRTRVRGVPEYTAWLWHHPEDAPPDLASRIHTAHARLRPHHAHLTLENS